MIFRQIAGVLSGAAGALGIGGGGVLMIYLIMFADIGQKQAQGINLLFFLPCGAVALIIHSVKKRVKWATVLPCVLGGAVGVLAGTALLRSIDAKLIAKGFAIGLIVLGVKELFSHKQEKRAHGNDS